MQKLPWLALMVAAVAATCVSPNVPDDRDDLPSWVGVYTVRADTVRYCVENQTPAGRTCDCGMPGYLEGTLTLAALTATDTAPHGTIVLRECPPGQPCGPDVSYQVIPFNGLPNPNPPPGPRLNFCAGLCPFSNNGGIQFVGAAIPANPMTGFFSRADGNIRACGHDSGEFTATRQP